MPFLDKLRSGGKEGPVSASSNQGAHDEEAEIRHSPVEITAVNEKATNSPADADGDLKPDHELPDLDAQLGVQKMEGITLSWSKKTLACLLVLFVAIRLLES